MRDIWLDRRAEITRLILVDRCTDAEMAERYGVKESTMRKVRSEFGLPPNPRPRVIASFVPIDPPMPYTTYVENGRTIKLFPPGYALVAITVPYTARPRR